MRRVVVWAVLVCACPGLAAAQLIQPRPQVRQIVAQQGCSNADLAPDVANAVVDSHAVLKDGKDCIIAFFQDLDRDGTPMEIISSREPLYGWNYAAIPVGDADRGPIQSIQLEGDFILVNLESTPDDYAIPILNTRLRQIGTIYGRFVRAWPNGLFEYEPRQLQPGPHFVQIGVFDPATGRERGIFPVSLCDPVRGDYVRQYYEALGGDHRLKDPCATESQRLAPSYFDWRTNAFAFAEELYNEYEPPPDWNKRVRVMVTCDGLATMNSIRCHETPLEAWQSARPDLNLTQLIAFAASQPRLR